ncbi:MAG TPA: VOC family protein, partial [Flavisolibacter sp.]
TPVTNLFQGIDTVILRVSNIDISREWYVAKLELTVQYEDKNLKLVVLATKSTTSLTLWQTEDVMTVNPNTASYPIFKTPDAQALQMALSERGIQVGEIIQDAYVRYFIFYDPDGNILEACQVHA